MSDRPKIVEKTIGLHQANERTMLAWTRTGISLMGFGFAIAKFGVFLRQVADAGHVAVHVPEGLGSASMGASLVALGTLANLGATVRYGKNRRAIDRGDVGAPHGPLVFILGGTAALVGLVMTVVLVRALGN